MELFTHALSGLVLSRAALEPELGTPAVWVFTVATVIPDAESVVAALGMPAYLKHHRGLSHSLLFTPLLALGLAGVWALIFDGISFGTLWAVALGGLLLHLLLDWVNSYGTQLLLPLSHRHFALDLDIIIDLWVFLPLLAAGVIQQVWPAHTGLTAAIGLGLCACGLVLRAVLRARAGALVPGERLGVLPGLWTMLHPFSWRVVQRDAQGLVVHDVFTGRGVVRTTEVPCLSPEALHRAAQGSRLGRAFVYWSRFPCVREERTEQGRRLIGTDLRFAASPDAAGTALHIEFDPQGRVVRESFRFGPPGRSERAESKE